MPSHFTKRSHWHYCIESFETLGEITGQEFTGGKKVAFIIETCIEGGEESNPGWAIKPHV